jgi:hypothetical protein
MREQIDFAGSPDFQDFMRGLNRLPPQSGALVHGVFIDVHPLFRTLSDGRRLTGSEDFPLTTGRELDPVQGGVYDLAEKPQQWLEFCKHSGKQESPFFVRVQVLPATPATLPARRAVEAYVRQQPFFAAVVETPQAMLALNVEGGIRVDASGPGTLGGFLRDQSGEVWGVTCGHVAPTVNAAFALPDVNGTVVRHAGTVIHSNFAQLSPSPTSALCNPFVGVAHSSVDVALIRLDPAHAPQDTVRHVGRVTALYDRFQLGSGNVLRMAGAVSGVADYAIGGYGVTVRIGLAGTGQQYCFTSLFDFTAHRNPSSLPARVAQALAPRPLPGDSGAWVCHDLQHGDYALFGMLVAVNGPTGIAIFADAVKDWADTTCQLTLQPL